MKNDIRKAIEVLKKGGIVIFPTDTAFGIGCRIDNAGAVERLFKIRKRQKNSPLLALVDSVKMAENYLLPIPKKVKDKLIKSYWPGKLTIILKCKDKVSPLVTGGTGTLGVRFPKHPISLELVRRVGVPIVAPSANFSGEKTPFQFTDLNPKLASKVDYVLKGKVSSEESVSTVIDCSVNPWRIIRQGAVKIQNVSLLIDTTDNKKITIGLIINGQTDIQSKEISSNKTQIILPMIENILQKHQLELKDLDTIEINTGPGSFTGLRVGISIANTLAFLLKIPINGKKIGQFVEPAYQ